MYFVLSFFFLTTFIHSEETKNDTLLFVHVHFRHGARSPMSINKEGKDYFNNTWDFPGELTPAGKRMEYILGLVLRYHYSTFISETYDPREIYLISSDINRTIQSGYSMLQGLYQSNSGPMINDNQSDYAVAPVNLSDPAIKDEIKALNNSAISNQKNVIPIHVYNIKEHRFLLQDPENCETLYTNHKMNLKMKSVEDIIQKFKSTIKNIRSDFLERLGVTEENLNFTYVSTFADQFVSGYYNNKKFEKFNFTTEEIQELLGLSNEILTISIRDQAFANGTDDSAIMASSPLFREMLTFMNRSTLRPGNLSYSDASYPKMYLVSGHDSSVGAAELFMQKAFNLNASDYYHPFYASNIRFELYKNGSVNETEQNQELYYVKYYFNEHLLQTWNYSFFNRTIRANLFTNEQIAEFCNFKSYGLSLLWWTNIILGFFCVLTIIGIVYIYVTQKNKIENENNGVVHAELLPDQHNQIEDSLKL